MNRNVLQSPGGTRRASEAVTPSASSFSRCAPSVRCGVLPRRGRRARQGCRAERGAPPIRAGTSRGPSAALPVHESCPPYGDRRGPRCAHRLPRTPQPPPSRRVGVRAPLRSGLGFAPGGRSRGAAWPPAARNRGLAPRRPGRRARGWYDPGT